MSDWLLKFGFGSVQVFVAQARKTRDLATGSRLISDLLKSALDTALAAPNTHLMMPADPATACPHQAILRVSDEDEQVVRTIGDGMRTAVEARWLALAEPDVMAKRDDVCASVADITAQLRLTFETHWVAVEDAADFSSAFNALQRAYDDRKWTRTFAQQPIIAGDPNGPWSCAQCGARGAVMRRLSDPAARARAEGTGGFFGRNDRLCAACLAKRLLSRTYFGDAFPSTLALARDRVFRAPVFEGLLADLRQLGYETQSQQVNVLEAWQEMPKGIQGTRTEPSAAEAQPDMRLARALALFGEGDFAASFQRLTPYYAIVLFDGDEMGKWFSGEHFDGAAHGRLAEAQSALGQGLSAFAAGLEALTEDQHRGRLVYAGGDDGFALLPLDTALPYLAAVHAHWEQTVPPAVVPFTEGNGQRPTLSAHVSLVHEHAPLQRVVADLHGLLEGAKERGGRNVFSVLADVRSGGDTRFVAKWEELEPFLSCVELFSTWRRSDGGTIPPPPVIRARRRDALPGRLPYLLLRAIPGFFDAASGDCIHHEGLRIEIQRLALRGDASKASASAVATFVAWLDRRVQWSRPGAAAGQRLIRQREALETALEILPFVAREVDHDLDRADQSNAEPTEAPETAHGPTAEHA